MLALGLAHEGNEELEEASTDFDQALQLYLQQQQPLGEADTRYERAGVFVVQGNLDAASDELARAITLVEQVMRTLSSPQQWSMLLQQYIELYAQAAIFLVQQNTEYQARTHLHSFPSILAITYTV